MFFLPLFSKKHFFSWSEHVCCFCRAKLAEWKASKGKTLKRPAMTPAAPSNKVPAKGKVEVQSHVEPVVAAECRSEAEPRLQPAAAAELQGQVLTHGPPPEVMNTTLDLLENSDIDLSAGPQDRVDDVSKLLFLFFPNYGQIPKLWNLFDVPEEE